MILSTGRELENADIQIIFVEGYNMALEDHDIIHNINENLSEVSNLTEDEAKEVLNKYHEILPLIEKALDEVFEDTNLDVI